MGIIVGNIKRKYQMHYGNENWEIQFQFQFSWTQKEHAFSQVYKRNCASFFPLLVAFSFFLSYCLPLPLSSIVSCCEPSCTLRHGPLTLSVNFSVCSARVFREFCPDMRLLSLDIPEVWRSGRRPNRRALSFSLTSCRLTFLCHSPYRWCFLRTCSWQ